MQLVLISVFPQSQAIATFTISAFKTQKGILTKLVFRAAIILLRAINNFAKSNSLLRAIVLLRAIILLKAIILLRAIILLKAMSNASR